ncbi:hypothetical protein KCP69_02590 [Salmonella enterica subsp. enterica]|nr:hypothetical protein KCP69_02590 [Salmonella enterica subsp. enterica]
MNQDIRNRTAAKHSASVLSSYRSEQIAWRSWQITSLKQVENARHIEPIGRELLLSACQYAEIGLSVDFKQAPYHAAYLVRHLDLHGYTPARKSCSPPSYQSDQSVDLSSLHQQNAVPPVLPERIPFAALAILFAGRRRDDTRYQKYATGAK